MTSSNSKARLWIKITLPGGGQLGPGKIALLKALDEHFSIAAAARALNMSYSRAWRLVDELNSCFAFSVVETHVGGKQRGGARLTTEGHDLVRRFESLVAAAQAATAEELNAFGSASTLAGKKE
ncbi:LysR family transcriptional regulator [Limibacillus sp. MBR-115]|jgi:molybdate transport system regulatory protein|uniref:winged helix-turn-helix domain-containing protein n=1 Tax=Limibacillus sp. MBR-115 TaxID=3156465 RepID=UPI0033944892